MANATERPDSRFDLDFNKLNTALLQHARTHEGNCDEIGDAFISTSIFALPGDFDDWPNRFANITTEQIDRTRRAVAARESFVTSAQSAGYKTDAVFRPAIREYIIRRLADRRYQEKQVDTSVVALLVRYAITRPGDYHCVITGDSDILPAIKIAYPEFTTNVFLASTHPDELNAMHRQTAFSLIDFDFEIPPFYLQMKEAVIQLISGDNVYRCEECGRIFTLLNPIPSKSRPRCQAHRRL
jgi:DNA-directed RNA polymerase subunit RPC12/RpoP